MSQFIKEVGNEYSKSFSGLFKSKSKNKDIASQPPIKNSTPPTNVHIVKISMDDTIQTVKI